MSFNHMLELLREKEKNKIVFVKLGTFYIAVGEDAVLLHKVLDLKCTCYKMNICKIGFPVNSLEKYVEKLNRTKYAYVIYDYDSNNIELKEILRKSGKHNKEQEKSINCILCSGLRNRYKEDKYVLAVNKMFEKEMQERNNKNKM